MHSKYICLLGFSKQAEQIIKNQLIKQCTDFEFVWVSANDKKLSGVIINAMFLDTPQIEKYVSTVKAPCVSIYTQAAGQHIALKHGIVAVELQEPLHLTNTWLNKLLSLQLSETTPPDMPKAKVEKKVSSETPLQKHDDYHELISLVKNRKQTYLVATHGNKLVYLSPSERNAYINFAREDIPSIEFWQWHTIENIPHSEAIAMRRINIDQWLFETIWQSEIDKYDIDSSMYYKLIRWPQPFSQQKRSEALRLAAQIKFHPVTISDLIEKTNFPVNLIKHFLFATIQAGQVEVVKPSSEVLKESKPIPARKDPDREVKRSFIGKLRAKLGL